MVMEARMGYEYGWSSLISPSSSSVGNSSSGDWSTSEMEKTSLILRNTVGKCTTQCANFHALLVAKFARENNLVAASRLVYL